MEYIISNGKIQTEACEINVVHHCNLACRSCSHLSPKSKKYFVEPSSVYNDLSILTRFYQPEYIRLVGGEPLLHPQLLNVVEAIRRSGITNRIRILTNGIVLGRMPDQFWQSVDEVHLSIYPDSNISSRMLDFYHQKSKKYHVHFEVLFFDYFREAYSDLGTQNKNLVQRIYLTCQIAQIWRCHNIYNGYFFKCPQSLFFPQGLSEAGEFVLPGDGIKLENNDSFFDVLLSFLQSPMPLSACNYCLGSVGQRFPHEQLHGNAGELRRFTTEEAIDWGFLLSLENDPHADNKCVRAM